MCLNKLCLGIGLLAWASLAAATDTLVDLELAASHDDNLSRAEAERDRFSDNLLDLGLTASRTLMLTPSSGLRLRGGLRLEGHARFTDLDSLTADLGASYRIQPVAGYTAPWIELGVALQRQAYRDSDIRDGGLLAVEAIVGKRFTDRIGGRLGIGREWRRADDAEVFEWQRNRIFAMVDYKLGLASTLYASLSRDFGDQVFTATPTWSYWEYAKAIAPDPVFGQRRAYRIGAISDSLAFGLSLPMNAFSTLDVGLNYFHSDADGGHSYNDTQLRASWLYRFK
jgi:hypothetical protein